MKNTNEFGIILFGHSRPLFIADVLKSLQQQNALNYVHVWLDGHQGAPDMKEKTEQVYNVVSKFPVAKVHRHNGTLGFRKIVLQALSIATSKFRYLMILEDDCFPTNDAVEIFQKELRIIENEKDIFSVYGHPFLVKNEKDVFTRFQGWGWGSTSEKLKPILDQLIDCYSCTEEEYLKFVEHSLTEDVLRRIDITPPRLPSNTLRKFFAWDETICLLTAMARKSHKKTPKRTIYNFGASLDSSRFKNSEWYLKPPFNMVDHKDIWEYFER